MNVLVTSASRKVRLVRAFQAALAGRGGRVVAADVNPFSAALYFADIAATLPPSNTPEFIDSVRRLCEREGIGLVIPTRDEELPVFAAGREELAGAGIEVAVSDPATIATCQDKREFLRFCTSHDLQVPPTFDSPSTAEFPAFVRPRFGKGGMGSMAVRSVAELEAATSRAGGEVIVQPLVDAPEYTIDLFADLRGTTVSVIPRRRLGIVAGESYIGRVEMRPDLIDVARRLASVMSFRGHITIQCFAGVDGPLMIEVNPRFGGAAALGWAAGSPTPEYLVRLVAGEQIEHDPSKIRDGLVMLRYADDLYLTQDELLPWSAA